MIDEAFDIHQALAVEVRYTAREAIDEVFELGIGYGAVDVSVSLGKLAIEIFTA